MTDAATIFISYAEPDRPIAERLHRALRSAGLMPWCDAIDLHADERWDEVIPRVMGRAQIVAVLISRHWPVAGEQGEGYYGPEEVARAIEQGRRANTRVVPIRLDGVNRERDPFGVFRVTGVEATSRDLGAVVHALRRIILRDARLAPEARPADPLAEAQHLRARRADEGASAKVLAALDARILKLKQGRLHGHKPEAGLRLDRWLLVEKRGRGGFAEVWEAEDMHTGEAVALKILHGQFDDSAERRARFFRGAARMAALDHPHIVRVIAPECAAEGRHFFVMELLPGGDLDAAVRQGTLDRRAGLECVVQIAEAVAAAHDAGLVHRDIKPANILLDVKGRPKLTDFDLVRAGDTTGGTRTGALGTFLYAAPEAMEDAGRVDGRADVYGLGMSALFVLLGKPLTRRMQRDPAKELSTVEGFGAAKREVLRAIGWEPDDRHAKAQTFADALARAMARPAQSVPTPGSMVAAASAYRPAMVYIPSGAFMLGSPPHQNTRKANEVQHRVQLTRPLLMATTPVTVDQHRALMGSQASVRDTRPVTGMSWSDAVAFCNALSEVEGLQKAYVAQGGAYRLEPTADGYRLPMEAEWEAACRAGTATRFWSGDDDTDLARVGWFAQNSGHKAHPVAEKPPNPWGLHDMHGNVWEWCHDWYSRSPAADRPEPLTNPSGPSNGDERVLRGGSDFSSADDCRSARRDACVPGSRDVDFGFRLVRPAPALWS